MKKILIGIILYTFSPNYLLAQPIPAQDLRIVRQEKFSGVPDRVGHKSVSWAPDVAASVLGAIHRRDSGRFAFIEAGALKVVGNGTVRTLIPSGLASHRAPLWAPDGQKMAAVTRSSIKVYDLITDQTYSIDVEPGTYAGMYTWSPSSEKIACTQLRNYRVPGGQPAQRQEHKIFICNYDGAEKTFLTDGIAQDWSLTKDELAFIRGEKVPKEGVYVGGPFKYIPMVWTINPSTFEEVKIPLPRASQPQWSPDGSKLLLSVGGKNGFSIWDIKTGQEIEVGDENAVKPVWSPDGSKVAFTQYDIIMQIEAKAINADIWVVNSDGSGLTNLTNTGNGTFEESPKWLSETNMVIEREEDRSKSELFMLTLGR